ncbi:MAG: hypothetical protein HYT70_03735 [Candidatus Aenigmarchaeota archaeon]|nr:hypothetical protein [Candidatus Aenigmarchaeota archaeon]
MVVSTAFAAVVVSVDDSSDSDRINRTGVGSIIWRFNVTNQPGSSSDNGVVSLVNISNATGYIVTAVNATGNATDACTIFRTAVNCTGAGFSIPVGSNRLINVTVTMPSGGVSGARSWLVNTSNSTGDSSAQSTVYTAAIDSADIAFDILNELGNTTGARVFVNPYNGSQITFPLAVDHIFNDSDNSAGLVVIESGNISNQQADTFLYNVTSLGYTDVNRTSVSYTNSPSGQSGNGYELAGGLPYGIKVTVQDQLGNTLTGATVNITYFTAPTTPITQSTAAPNATAFNIQYYALPDVAVGSNNFTILVSRSGFLNNATFNNDTSPRFGNTSLAQVTGNSTYALIFVVRVNVSDELLATAQFDNGVGFSINGTASTANQSSGSLYYFSIPTTWTAINLTTAKSGYVNNTVVDMPVNATTQATMQPQLLFRLKITAEDELDSGAVFDNGVTIMLNNTITSASSQSTNSYYFNTTNVSANISVGKLGYINSTNNTLVLINATSQAAVFTGMNFSVRVTDICNELVTSGHCYLIDGTASTVQISGLAIGGAVNTTYSSDGYINATNPNSSTPITITAVKDGFVNISKVVFVNQSAQTRLVFNTTDGTGVATDRANALPFTLRVLSVFDELGTRNFTLNNTATYNQAGTTMVGVDVFEQANNVFYELLVNTNSTYAYVNATGTSVITVNAFLGNLSLVNGTVAVTPTADAQRTIIFNGTGINTTDNAVSAYATGKGLNYTIRINVTDELGIGNSSYMNSGVTFGFNSSGGAPGANTFAAAFLVTADKQSNNVYYFSNASLTNASFFGTNVTIAKNGYINTSSAANFPINASNQSQITLQMPFNFRVQANDELGVALGAIPINYSVNATGGFSQNASDATFAYFALPTPSLVISGTTYVNVSKRGYVDNGTSVFPINTSAQAQATQNMLYTIRVFYACSEQNFTCFNISGIAPLTDGAAVAEVSGLASNYSGGVAFIPASNDTRSTITISARGYTNTSVAASVSATTRNGSVVFNVTNPADALSNVNGSALNFTIRVLSICDQLNYTCFLLNGSTDFVGAAAVNVSGTAASASVNSTRYSSGIAYIPVPGTSAVNLVANSVGFINSTQSTTPTPGGNQVTVNWNSTIYGLNYSVRINVLDELSQSNNMNSGVTVARNFSAGAGTILVENNSVFRSSLNSNVFYANVSTLNTSWNGGANMTVRKDGYINTTSANFPVNSSLQANVTLNMPFSVKVNTGSVTAVTAIVTSGSSTFAAIDGNASSDTNSTADGVIYWALNQSNVVGGVTGGNVLLQLSKANYVDFTFVSMNLNYSSQLTVSPTMVRSNADDTNIPVLNLTSPTAGSNVTTTTPTISFTLIDNDGGAGIDVNSITVNISGFNFTRDCTQYNARNVSCSYTASALTDQANQTIQITAQDNAGNNATTITRAFGVDTLDGVTATLYSSDINATNDNTYGNGWSFTFNITLGSTTTNATGVNATAVRIANWTKIGGPGAATIPTANNTIMNYTISNGTAATYYVSHNYNTTDTIYPLQDLHEQTAAINGTVTIYVKLPPTAVGTYSTTFTFGSWSVALTGGNPT